MATPSNESTARYCQSPSFLAQFMQSVGSRPSRNGPRFLFDTDVATPPRFEVFPFIAREKASKHLVAKTERQTKSLG